MSARKVLPEVAQAKTMREAAKTMRKDEDARWHRVAYWLEAESSLLEMVDPFTSLLSAIVVHEGGDEGSLKLIRHDSGEMSMRVETTSFGMAVARAYLGAAS